MTRGIVNNNPGNIRHGDPWQGLAPEQTDPSFCQFIAPEWGIRAIAKIMASYKEAGIMTLRSAISRWAPSSENDTNSYIQDVSNKTALDPDSCIDLLSYPVCKSVVKAIIFHENGVQPYADDVINHGLSLAGVEP